MIGLPPRSTLDRSSAASDVYKRQVVSAPKPALAAPTRAAPGLAPSSRARQAIEKTDRPSTRMQSALRTPAGESPAAPSGTARRPVSYTHLTLPTSDLV